MSNVDDLSAVAELLIAHGRVSIESCYCGWGSNAGNLGESHPLHVAQQLAEAGLIYDNTWLAENYQLASGRLAKVRELVEHRAARYARRGGIRAVPVADLRRALGLAPDPGDCNQLLTAVWCPLHGDCACPGMIPGDDGDCPLHASSSSHGEGS